MSTNPRSDEPFWKAIRDLETQRKSRIFCVIHRGGGQHICAPTFSRLLTRRDEVGTGDTVELLLHSGGGHPEYAYRVMKFFRRRFKTVNVIVPLWAKSSATLMCLGADRLFVGEFADLGPIDIQINDQVEHGQKSFSPLDEFKSLEFLREQALEWMDWYAMVMNVQYGMSIKEALKDSIPLVSAVMRPIFEQIDPVEMGGYRRAIAIGEEYAKRMLALTKNPNAAEIIQKTVWGYPSHDFCIDFEEVEELGLPVERLEESQDRKLTDALIVALKEYGPELYGFPPSAPDVKPTRPARARRPRQVVPAAKTRGARRINGSGRAGPPERI